MIGINFLTKLRVSLLNYAFLIDCFICVSLALTIFIAYGQVTGFEFLNLDDYDYVKMNPIVNKGITPEGIQLAFTSVHSANWHPLTWMSHMLDVELYGMNPGMHHFTSVIIHSFNAILLFIIFKSMTGGVWRSALLAALFALHPLHVESVAWISERKDVLSTLFWISTMLAYYWYVKKRCLTRYLLVLSFFVLGLLSKPMVITLPFVLFLLDFWPLNRLGLNFQDPANNYGNEQAMAMPDKWIRKLSICVVEKVPLILLAIVSSAITVYAQQKGQAIISLDIRSFGDRIINVVVSYVTYIEKMLLPLNLSSSYPYRDAIPIYLVLLCSAFIILVTLFSLIKAKKCPYMLVGWFWYLVTLVPVIGIVQVGSQSMANRYTYIPLIGIFLIIIWGINDLFSQKFFERVVVGVLCALTLAVTLWSTYDEVGYWKNSETLFTRALDVTGNNAFALLGLGHALLSKGDSYGAMEKYIQILKINPEFCDAYNNIGGIMFLRGNYDAAIRYYSISLSLNPHQFITHRNLGISYYRKGNITKAIESLQIALRENPDYSEAIKNLKSIREAQKNR